MDRSSLMAVYKRKEKKKKKELVKVLQSLRYFLAGAVIQK